MTSMPNFILVSGGNKVCISFELPVSVKTNITGSLPIWKYFLDICKETYYNSLIKILNGLLRSDKVLLTPRVRRSFCDLLDRHLGYP